MLKSTIATVAAVSIFIASTLSANAHVIRWSKGGSRTVGFGHCAKGPCMKRASFFPSVPHRHLSAGQ